MPDHRVIEDWMGEPVETLEDLLHPGLLAVCVGINPSPVSVAAGHYYQGRLGRGFFERLGFVGLLPDEFEGYEDDAAFTDGVGFTDVVKRPTTSAKELQTAEFEHGRALLADKLGACRPALTVFTFKKTAEVLFGPFAGNGFIDAPVLGESPVFVMPGPYESTDTVKSTLRSLEHWVKRQRRLR